MNLARWIGVAGIVMAIANVAARGEPPQTPTFTGQSLYQLASQWTTDAGRTLTLAELAGQYQIVAFIFTQCDGVCPVQVKSLQTQARNLPASLKKRTGFLLVSIDPQHDTVQALQRYRQEMALDSHWTLLRGREPDVRELTAALGFNYQRLAQGQFSHSNQVTLLDPNGEIVLQHPSAEGAVVAATEAIAASLRNLSAIPAAIP